MTRRVERTWTGWRPGSGAGVGWGHGAWLPSREAGGGDVSGPEPGAMTCARGALKGWEDLAGLQTCNGQDERESFIAAHMSTEHVQLCHDLQPS
jgi:hypothetical protein